MNFDTYYQPPEPTFCFTHGEDCDADPMDECDGFEPDPCNICGFDPCNCDDQYEAFRESRWED